MNLQPVWVGMGTAADFDGRDVRGKAVVAYGFPNPGGRENTALTFGTVKRAEEEGAAALFIVLGFPGNVMNEPTAAGTTAARADADLHARQPGWDADPPDDRAESVAGHPVSSCR